MFDFLRGKRPGNQTGSAPVTVTTGTGNHNSDVRRELIRVVLKDTLRQHGIPLDWLACEVIVIPRAPDKETLHIQLVLMRWNDQLMRYALALQQQLLIGLDRFDPEIDHSGYVISWRFSPKFVNPFPVLPEPSHWLEAVPPKAAATPVSVLDRRKARRPAKAPATAPAAATARSTPTSYEPTRIAPLS
jgi:hypothetical protein